MCNIDEIVNKILFNLDEVRNRYNNFSKHKNIINSQLMYLPMGAA